MQLSIANDKAVLSKHGKGSTALGNLRQRCNYRLHIKDMLISFGDVTASDRSPCSSEDESESHELAMRSLQSRIKAAVPNKSKYMFKHKTTG